MKNPDLDIAPEALGNIFSDTIYVKGETHNAQPKKEAEVIQTDEAVNFNFKGGNKKEILILIESSGEGVNQADLNFLLKILGAVKLQESDVAIINPKDQNFEISKAAFPIKTILIFGVNPFEVGIKDQNFTSYDIHQWNGKNVLKGDTLSTISQNQDKKKALWVNLQRLFL
jgi:DNA polymerase III psi subunit